MRSSILIRSSLLTMLLALLFQPLAVFALTCENPRVAGQYCVAVGTCVSNPDQTKTLAGGGLLCASSSLECCRVTDKPAAPAIVTGCGLDDTGKPTSGESCISDADCKKDGGTVLPRAKSDSCAPIICCAKAAKTDGPAALGPGQENTLVDPLGSDATILTVIQRVIASFLGIAGALALAIFVYGGVVYMTAGGDAKRVQQAQDTLKYAAIGLVIISFAYTIANTLLYLAAGSG